MVAGLEEISEAVVLIGDRFVTHIPSRDRDIAMVFQSYALYPHLTVYDNIAFGLRLQKLKPGDSCVYGAGSWAWATNEAAVGNGRPGKRLVDDLHEPDARSRARGLSTTLLYVPPTKQPAMAT
jgi:ABC-type sugar transport system ATPase subunit